MQVTCLLIDDLLSMMRSTDDWEIIIPGQLLHLFGTSMKGEQIKLSIAVT